MDSQISEVRKIRPRRVLSTGASVSMEVGVPPSQCVGGFTKREAI